MPDPPHVAIDAILFLKRTGVPIAVWTREPIPSEVVTVMAATMLSSIDTLMTVFGGKRPENVVVETDGRRILSRALDSSAILVIVAPLATRVHILRKEARRLIPRFARIQERTARGKASSAAEVLQQPRPLELPRR